MVSMQKVEKTSNVSKVTATCALFHLLVDGLCVCCLYKMAGSFDETLYAGVFITYTVLAFLTQPLTGLLADHALRHSNILILAAVAFLSIAVLIASVAMMVPMPPKVTFFLVAILLGMGNSLFHVWGGKLVAHLTRNDIRALGVFVATGALGLGIGVVFASWLLLYGLLIAIAIMSAMAIRITDNNADKCSDSVEVFSGRVWWAWCAVLLLMAFVGLRSYLGEALAAGVSYGAGTILLIGSIAMLGKAAGGWIAKGIGLWQTLVLALIGTLLCLWLKSSLGWLWIPGVLLINFTMAVTLYLCNKVMPGREGLAFGLLAASLMPGYLLAQITDTSTLLPTLVLNLTLTIAIELGVLWLLREKRADVLWSSVVVNILTNLPLNLCLFYVGGGWTAIAVGEALVLLAETVWYRFFTSSWKRGAIYSILCNTISFLVGLLILFAMKLFQIL